MESFSLANSSSRPRRDETSTTWSFGSGTNSDASNEKDLKREKATAGVRDWIGEGGGTAAAISASQFGAALMVSEGGRLSFHQTCVGSVLSLIPSILQSSFQLLRIASHGIINLPGAFIDQNVIESRLDSIDGSRCNLCRRHLWPGIDETRVDIVCEVRFGQRPRPQGPRASRLYK
jgi:hypothetical protein